MVKTKDCTYLYCKRLWFYQPPAKTAKRKPFSNIVLWIMIIDQVYWYITLMNIVRLPLSVKTYKAVIISNMQYTTHTHIYIHQKSKYLILIKTVLIMMYLNLIYVYIYIWIFAQCIVFFIDHINVSKPNDLKMY